MFGCYRPGTEMVICEICTTAITNKSPGLKCSGKCLKYFHGKCVGLSKQVVSNFKTPGALWFCRNCRSDREIGRPSAIGLTNPVLSSDDEDEVPSPNGTSQRTLKIVETIQSELKSLNSKNSDLMASVSFCSDQITHFEAVIKEIGKKLENLEGLARENSSLKKEVKSLNTRVDLLEQQIRMQNLEIYGIPEKSGENLLKISERIGEFIECAIEADDVDSIFRANSSAPGQPKPVIVKLTTRKKKEAILAAAKIKRLAQSRVNSAPGLSIEGISNKLFINEHLTAHTKTILKQAKDMAKQKNYKFVWVRNGTIYARKVDNSRVLTISNENDLKKIQ